MESITNNRRGGLIVAILTLGVFGIINTEMGVVGIIPQIAQRFDVTVPQAGWVVGLFALIVAISAPITPLLFSAMNRKKAMVMALSIFVASNIVSIFAQDFTVLLIARAIPAIFHPIYVSMAFTVAGQSVPKDQAPKAISRIFIGVSAGMVLGVPVTSYIVGQSDFSVAMIFFGAVNLIVLLATIFCIPSIPVRERLSYGAQLSVLRDRITWYSIVAVVLINGAMFGFFSYMSDYLENVTNLGFKAVSIFLLVYGGSNIVGNLIAGKWLAVKPLSAVKLVPLLMLPVYAVLYALGELTIPMAAIVLVLGILAGIASNNCQWMISNAAPKAPDFANGLFLASTNFGTMLGTSFCGLFISQWDTRYSVFGAIVFLLLGLVFIFLRDRGSASVKTAL